MQYRRAFIPGGCYFFTLVTKNRRKLFIDNATVDVLRNAFRKVMVNRPFEINAMVVLPDHLHCIWTLPEDDADFSTRWRLIKTWFTKHCDPDLRRVPEPIQARRGEQSIWQHRYWEHLLKDEADYRHHVDYIHYNPVKHGLALNPMDWPYSSFRRYVKAGILPKNWGAAEIIFDEGIGNE